MDTIIMRLCRILLIALLIYDSSEAKSTTGSRIYSFIFDGYQSHIMPQEDAAQDPLVVEMTMILYQIIEVNSKEQFMHIYVSMQENWYDDFLYWNPEDYNNTTELSVNRDDVWTPDTYLYNLVDDDDPPPKMPVIIIPSSTLNSSLITARYPAMYKFSCNMNPKWFPWDSQICTARFGSWTLKASRIEYRANPIILQYYWGHPMWQIKSTSTNQVYEMINGRNASVVNFTFHLHRMPWYFIFNLILPTVVVTIIVFIGMFSTDSSTKERGEKMGTGITGVLALAVILLIIDDELPKTSLVTPLISWYCLIMIITIGLALVTSIMVLRIQRQGEFSAQPPPAWAMKLFCLKSDSTLSDSNAIENIDNDTLTKPHTETIEYSSGIHKVDAKMVGLHVELHTMRKMLARTLQMVNTKLSEGHSILNDWERLANRVESAALILFIGVSGVYTAVFIIIGYCQRD